MIPVVNVYRGGVVESIHYGSVAVVDSAGRLLASVGDPAFPTFIRSAAKPFQILPLLRAGGIRRYDLTPQEIAIMCASHGGEPHHVATVGGLLRRRELDESDLVCPAHPPYDEKARIELEQSGEQPTALHNNCSGNHTALLLGSEIRDLPSGVYHEMASPIQLDVLENLAEFAGLEPAEIDRGIDGCGVPAFRMSLFRAALAYARLAERSYDDDSWLHEECRAIFEAMTGYPEYVAGGWSMTTPLVRQLGGHVLGKEGAEGFYAMALDASSSRAVHETCESDGDEMVGIALKISDGSSERSRNPVVLRTLQLLGVPIDFNDELNGHIDPILRNLAGEPVGEARAEFELSFL